MDNSNISSVDDGYAMLNISLTSNELDEHDLSTRLSVAQEDDVNNLHVLVYGSDNNLLAKHYFTASPYAFPVPIGTGYTVYAIANTGNANAFTETNAGTVNDLMALTTSDGISSKSDMLMSGKSTDGSVSIVRTVKNNLCAITLKRLAAKITLNISAAEGQAITIDSYSIADVPSKSYYMLHPLSTEDVDYTDGTTSAYLEEDVATAGTDATAITDTWITYAGLTDVTDYSFYMYENRRGVNSTITSQKDKGASNAPAKATYVEIYGKTNQNTAVWRVYLGASNTSNFNIKRNAHYTYNIKLMPTVTDTRVTWTSVPKTSTATVNLQPANCFMIPATGGNYAFDATIKGNGKVPFSVSGTMSATIPLPGENTTYTPFVLWSMRGTPSDDINGVVQSVSYNSTTGIISFTATNSGCGNAVIALKTNNGTPSDASDDYILWSWHVWKTDYDPSDAGNGCDTYIKSTAAGAGSFKQLKMMKVNLGACYSYATYNNLTSTGLTSDMILNGLVLYGDCGLQYQWGRKDPFLGYGGTEQVDDTYSVNYPHQAARMTNAIATNYAWHDGTSGSDDAIRASTISISGKSGTAAVLEYAVRNPTHYIQDGRTGVDTDWLPTIQDDLWGTPYPVGKAMPTPTTNYVNTNYGVKSIYDPCPAGYRVPPNDVWQVLTNSGVSTGSTTGSVEANANIASAVGVTSFAGRHGYNFYSQPGKTGDVIFLPAIGQIAEKGYNRVGTYIVYWTSSVHYQTSQGWFGAAVGSMASYVNPIGWTTRSLTNSVRCCRETKV
jgi:hypothetical protein